MAHAPFPPSSLIKKTTTSIQSLLNDITPHRQPLPEDRRGVARPRPGSDFVTVQVVDRAREQGLETQSLPIARLEDLRSHAKDLRPLVEATQTLSQIFTDLLSVAESGVWSGTLLYYGMLKHNAQSDANLREKMADINDFFTRRSPAVREEQALARAERKAARATQKAARAKQAADAIKARRVEPAVDFVIMPARGESNGKADGVA